MRRLQHRVAPVALAASCLRQHMGMTGRFSSSGATSAAPKSREGETPSASAQPAAAGDVLPGVDLAKRVADPSPSFPASWSADEPLAANDPRVVWKEQYSLAEEKPYYHNVNTNETTFEIPEGFVTRFPQLYKRSGFTVDENGAVFRGNRRVANIADGKGEDGAAAAADGEAAPGKKKLTTKQKLAAYGGGGLLWYLIVHNICLATVFSLLYFFKVDLVAVARSYGFHVKLKRTEQVQEIAEDAKRSPSFFKTFFLAIILNKLLVPVQLVFTLATAPLLVHRLEPLAVVLMPRCKAFFQGLKLKITGATP